MSIFSQLYLPRIPQNHKFQTLPFQRICRSPLPTQRKKMDKEIIRHLSTKGDGNGRKNTLMNVAMVTVPAAFQNWKTVYIFSHDDMIPGLNEFSEYFFSLVIEMLGFLIFERC